MSDRFQCQPQRHSSVRSNAPRLLALGALLVMAPLARTEVVSVSATAEVELEQFRRGLSDERSSARLTHPESPLPLQAVATLVAQGEDSAALGGAQFAAPTIGAPNPQELALNVTCDSLSPDLAYRARGVVEEVRTIILRAGEVNRPSGSRAAVIGRLTLDGALAIYATDSNADLRGAEVSLFARIEQAGGPDGDGVLLSGAVRLIGLAGGQVRVEVSGNLPTSTLILTNLASTVPELGVFHVLIIPGIVARYDYSATIDSPFDLRLKVETVASNAPDGVGATGLLGSPTDALLDVIGLARGSDMATKIVNAVQRERDDPTGGPAVVGPSAFGLCGVLGLETAVGLAGLAMLGGRRRFARG